ncbi:hypothetical protein HMPREF2975_05190 [Actinomyces sp. HMSC065F12]|nr:hypothetical protein HMPREF2975_05190 [Actinomyces sp. HMSC065F12]
MFSGTLSLASRDFDARRHTSNAPEFLTAMYAYRGKRLYEHVAAGVDQHAVAAVQQDSPVGQTDHRAA